MCPTLRPSFIYWYHSIYNWLSRKAEKLLCNSFSPIPCVILPAPPPEPLNPLTASQWPGEQGPVRTECWPAAYEASLECSPVQLVRDHLRPLSCSRGHKGRKSKTTAENAQDASTPSRGAAVAQRTWLLSLQFSFLLRHLGRRHR